MKFILTRNHSYWWPVKVAIPHPEKDRAGEYLEMEFRMQFQSLPRDEADAIAERLKTAAAELPAGAVAGSLVNEDIRRVTVGWDESVVDEDGNPIPFTAEAFDELLQISWYRLAVYRAWGSSLIGDAARLGN